MMMMMPLQTLYITICLVCVHNYYYLSWPILCSSSISIESCLLNIFLCTSSSYLYQLCCLLLITTTFILFWWLERIDLIFFLIFRFHSIPWSSQSKLFFISIHLWVRSIWISMHVHLSIIIKIRNVKIELVDVVYKYIYVLMDCHY